MANDNLKEILHYTDITGQISMGGQPTRSQLRGLKKGGFESVVQLKVREAEEKVPDEANILGELGVNHEGVNISFMQPQPQHLEAFFDAMERHQGNRVFVHCVAGFCTSGFMFLYQVIKLGMTVDEARSLLKKVWQPNEVWHDFIKQTLARHGIEYTD